METCATAAGGEMMIRETIEIQCDKCGKHEQAKTMLGYRTSGLMGMFMTDLTINGWLFVRDERYKLERVLCPHCNKTEVE